MTNGAQQTDPKVARPDSGLWRNRDYVLLLSGQVVSFIGDQMQAIAVPLLVLDLTGSASDTGIVLGLSTIAFLFISLVAGAFVDRWDRKRLMIVCDLGRMLAALSIAIALFGDRLTIPQLAAVAVFTSVLGTFFSIANTASLTNVVTDKQLVPAMTTMQTAFSVVRLGATVGGFVYSLSQVLPFTINAISFGISALSVALIRTPFQRTRHPARANLWPDITEGFAWLWADPLLRFLTLMTGADALRFAAGYLIIIVLAQQLGASATQIGLIFTGAGVGALIGNLIAARVRARFSLGQIAIATVWLEALVFPLYAAAPNVAAMAVIAATESVLAPIYQVSLDGYRSLATPDHLRGRTTSVVQLVVRGASPIGSLVAGFAIDGLGAQATALLFGAWLAVIAIATTLNRRVRMAGKQQVA